MAMGWSGSNGGISPNQKRISVIDVEGNLLAQRYTPLEVSYFVNNVCNLRCRHCYVGYNETGGALSVAEWQRVFDDLVSIGARTFGNVGREPLLTWDKTRKLLVYFQRKRESMPELRFGLVTNGTLLDATKIGEINQIQPDYLDISLDGTKSVNDYVRGQGNFDKTVSTLVVISKCELVGKVFISFTANKLNLSTMSSMVDMLYDLGFRRILISPYVTLDETDGLYLSNDEIIDWTEKLLTGRVVNFSKYRGLSLYIKNDYATTLALMEEFALRGIIDLENLFVDDYGVIFSKYTFGGNEVYFNYLPWNDFLVRAIRISHDGYISNCLDMFFKDYPERAIGNVRTKPISQILKYDALLPTPVDL